MQATPTQPHLSSSEEGMSHFTKKQESGKVPLSPRGKREVEALISFVGKCSTETSLYLCSEVQKILNCLRGTEMGINLRNRFLTRVGTERFWEQNFYVTGQL